MVGTILQHITIENELVQVDFVVIKNLVIPAVLGRAFINRFLKGIFSPGDKIVLYSSALALRSIAVAKTIKTRPRVPK